MFTYNSFNELATANTTLVQSQMSVFNADFAGVEWLTPEQRQTIQPFMDAVNEAERKFREKYDQIQKQEEIYYTRRDENPIFRAAAAELKEQRHILATTFDRNDKARLEAPLKPYGVTVSWDEPQGYTSDRVA